MSLFNRLGDELGLAEFFHSGSRWDIGISYASRFIRLFGFGLVAPILILYLNASLGISNRFIGLFLTITLWGDVVLSLLVTWSADKVGRRNTLAIGSLLMAIAGVIFATSSSFFILLGAATIGVISPSGNEVGPFSAVEVAMLSQLVRPEGRVHILMWYQVLGFVGTSLGTLSSGYIIQIVLDSGRSLEVAYRAVFWAYAAVGLLKIVFSSMMTPRTELHSAPVFIAPLRSSRANTEAEANARMPLLSAPNRSESSAPTVARSLDQSEEDGSTPETRALPLARLISLSALFGIDSFASALVPSSFIAYFLNIHFHAPLAVITSTLSIGAMLSCFSQLLAGSIARRLGLISTMVFTHMPAQLLTIGFGFAPTLSIALVLLWARFSIASMDTSVRSSFLAAIVPRLHRARFLGIINVSKTLCNSLGYSLAGQMAEMGWMSYSFLFCGLLKLIYDIGLLVGFKSMKLEH